MAQLHQKVKNSSDFDLQLRDSAAGAIVSVHVVVVLHKYSPAARIQQVYTIKCQHGMRRSPSKMPRMWCIAA